MKVEALVTKLQKALGTRMRSVILYGSAVAGDHTGKQSDYNVLVVADQLGIAELTALSKPSLEWRKAGNPLPLFFTLERLQKSADVFPIELMDIRESHRVLYGEDVLSQVEVHPENLRLILEHQLKSSLIQLREGVLETEGKAARVGELMTRSLSTILVLFRASLRLYRDAVPSKKMEATRELAQHIAFDTSIFATIEEIKEGRRDLKSVDPLDLCDRYLRNVEIVVDAVDVHVRNSLS